MNKLLFKGRWLFIHFNDNNINNYNEEWLNDKRWNLREELLDTWNGRKMCGKRFCLCQFLNFLIMHLNIKPDEKKLIKNKNKIDVVVPIPYNKPSWIPAWMWKDLKHGMYKIPLPDNDNDNDDDDNYGQKIKTKTNQK